MHRRYARRGEDLGAVFNDNLDHFGRHPESGREDESEIGKRHLIDRRVGCNICEMMGWCRSQVSQLSTAPLRFSKSSAPISRKRHQFARCKVASKSRILETSSGVGSFSSICTESWPFSVCTVPFVKEFRLVAGDPQQSSMIMSKLGSRSAVRRDSGKSRKKALKSDATE